MKLLREQNAVLMQKLDVMAEELAEATALIKVSVKVEEVPAAMSLPIKSEEELDRFGESLTHQIQDFYINKVRKMLGSCPLSKCLKNIIDEDTIKLYNLDGTCGKKRLKNRAGIYSILKEALEQINSIDSADRSIRKAIQNVKNNITKKKTRNK
ncbi:uncharacterized protein LOC111081828 [Drosophila obscura]|uniref:uncharacterized protein LOC111081828 n=1 Tax=Drosophila obscura TaxID=7282 RepID=UPI001BB1CA5E|nr:uncharacterized protein LOC111081828 [Drosophila obscura]